MINTDAAPKRIIEIHEALPLEFLPDNTDRKNIVMNLVLSYCGNGQFDKAIKVLDYGTYPWVEKYCERSIAIANSDKSKLLELLQNEKNIWNYYRLASEAICSGNQSMAQILLEKGEEEAKDDPLLSAIFNFYLKQYNKSIYKLGKIDLDKYTKNQDYSKALVYFYYFLNYREKGDQEKSDDFLKKLQKLQLTTCEKYKDNFKNFLDLAHTYELNLENF